MTRHNKIHRSESEWQEVLSPEQYKVMRQQATEPAFSGKYHDCKEAGIYVCAGCDAALFGSDSKFDSGSGWPSYWQPLSEDAIGTTTDNKFGMQRIEVHCSNCGAHLGHVFTDGPQPTGLRYCINSLSLNLEKKDQDKP